MSQTPSSFLRDSYLHPLLNGLVILLILWLAGLVLFAADVAGQPEGMEINVRKADGIVVLTGGAARVPAGLDLLARDIAPRLMISGVDPRADTDALVPESHPARGRKACCITFGTYAEDTIGNARETAAWAQRHGIKSLIVVTSNYHIRRAIMEFRQALPDVILIPYVVTADHVRIDDWWNHPGTAALMVNEYSKYLLALVKASLHKIFNS